MTSILKNAVFSTAKSLQMLQGFQSNFKSLENVAFSRGLQTMINTARLKMVTNTPTVSSTSRLLQNQKLPTIDQIRTTTYELKQWRENRVINRYFRLNWGGWIRTRGGRFKSLYRKTAADRWRLKKHIFLTRKQSALMDKMVTPGWRKPKHYVDQGMEIYQPYQSRTQSYHHPNHTKFYP